MKVLQVSATNQNKKQAFRQFYINGILAFESIMSEEDYNQSQKFGALPDVFPLLDEENLEYQDHQLSLTDLEFEHFCCSNLAEIQKALDQRSIQYQIEEGASDEG